MPTSTRVDPTTRNIRTKNGDYTEYDEEELGITTLQSTPQATTPHYYDLQGRRLSHQPAKGIYIDNERKIVK